VRGRCGVTARPSALAALLSADGADDDDAIIASSVVAPVVAEFDPSNPFDIADDAPHAVMPVRAVFTPAVTVFTDSDDDDADADDDLVAWLAAQTWSDFAQSLARQARKGRPLSARQVQSARSMRAKCEARQAEKAARLERAEALAERAAELRPELGDVQADRIYVVDSGRQYKVQAAKSGGHLYAKVLDVSSGRFEYVAGAIAELRADGSRRVLSMSEAIAHGVRFGSCVCCGRTLTAGKSIEAGIGPVCAGRWGLG
jgi:hypothetical protein